MAKSKGIKNLFRGIMAVLAVMLLETVIHFVILLLVKGFHYSWSGFFNYYENTGTYLIEDLVKNAFSILALRLIFLEFLVRIPIQLATIRFELKLFLSLLFSILYIVGFSTLFFGDGFAWDDFFSLYFGWYFHLPLAIISVSLSRLILYRLQSKSYQHPKTGD